MAANWISPVPHVAEIVLDKTENKAHVAMRPYANGVAAYLRGRLAEDVPLYVQRTGADAIAAHLVAVAALDNAYSATPPEKACHLRAALAACGVYYHHLLRLFFSRMNDSPGVSALIATGDAIPVLDVMTALQRVRDAITVLGGRGLTPERGVPGGMTKGLSEGELNQTRTNAAALLEFALAVETAFRAHGAEWVKNQDIELPLPAVAIVNEDGKSSLYAGEIRVVDPHGKVLIDGDLDAAVKFMTGDAPYRVGPLARVNTGAGMPTPQAQEALERMVTDLGGPPLHRVAAVHWLSVIELVAAAELAVAALDQLEPGDSGLRAPLSAPGTGTAAIATGAGVMVQRLALDAHGLVMDFQVIVPQLAREVNAALQTVVGKVNPERMSDETIAAIEGVIRAYQPAFVPEAPFPLRITARGEDGATIAQWRKP